MTRSRRIITTLKKGKRKYSAAVLDRNGKTVVVSDREYQTKEEFIADLKVDGYTVIPQMVKESDLFDYILNNTSCSPDDWKIETIPERREFKRKETI